MRRASPAPVTSNLYRNFAVVALVCGLGAAFFGSGPESAAAADTSSSAKASLAPQAQEWPGSDRQTVEIVAMSDDDNSQPETDVEESARLAAARTAEERDAKPSEARGPVQPSEAQIANLLAASARRSGSATVD